MNLEHHDFIIVAVIAVIILIQVIVFLKNLIKIRKYKISIGFKKDFEIFEIDVPEDWIKEIEMEEILKDPVSFQKCSKDFIGSDLREFKSTSNKSKTDTMVQNDQDIKNEKLSEINPTPDPEVPEGEKADQPDELKNLEIRRDEEEIIYDGPLKSVREKLKRILE